MGYSNMYLFHFQHLGLYFFYSFKSILSFLVLFCFTLDSVWPLYAIYFCNYSLFFTCWGKSSVDVEFFIYIKVWLFKIVMFSLQLIYLVSQFLRKLCNQTTMIMILSLFFYHNSFTLHSNLLYIKILSSA